MANWRDSEAAGKALGVARTFNLNYTREFVLERDRITGAAHGLAHAEAFHYVSASADRVDEHVRQHGVPR